jgi:hypothetical protein
VVDEGALLEEVQQVGQAFGRERVQVQIRQDHGRSA